MPLSPSSGWEALSPGARRPQDDGALANQCREWYEAYGRLIYRYIRFHVSSADIAEDLTADTFLKAIHSLHQFTPAKGTVRVWLLRIAANTLRDHCRRSRVRHHISLGHLRDLANDAPSPEERLLREEQITQLLDAIANLSPHDQELISLRYGSELDSAAIAQVQKMSEAAVRQGLSRALRRLRQALEYHP